MVKSSKMVNLRRSSNARSPYGSISIAILSILLALCAQTLNVSFLVSFAFCIGASANLPVILYTIYWKKFNSNGAIIAMATGLISCSFSAQSGRMYGIRKSVKQYSLVRHLSPCPTRPSSPFHWDSLQDSLVQS